MRQFRKYGSVRGVSGNRLLYRDPSIKLQRQTFLKITTFSYGRGVLIGSGGLERPLMAHSRTTTF